VCKTNNTEAQEAGFPSLLYFNDLKHLRLHSYIFFEDSMKELCRTVIEHSAKCPPCNSPMLLSNENSFLRLH